MVAGSKRRKIEDVRTSLTVAHLEDKLQEINNINPCEMTNRNSCLIALLYLSGRRITEILHLKNLILK